LRIGYARVVATRIFAVLLVAFALGCPADSPDQGEGESEAETEEGWLPDACSAEESPFTQPECLTAIREACNAQQDEASCNGTDPLPFSGYGVTCGWAEVVTFSDLEMCNVESVEGRCEANLCQDGPGPGGPCEASAIPSESAFIQLCGGPLGSWDAVGSEEQSPLEACEDGTEPAICGCFEKACSAL